MLGFFDLGSVEVMRGPQALFFGKNSPAGVISVTSAGPTRQFEFGGTLSYEFAGREMVGEAHVAGPISDSLGGGRAVPFCFVGGWVPNHHAPHPTPPSLPPPPPPRT